MAMENRGGNRPTASQNNYKVTATGGSGNSGQQPARYAAGIENAQDFMELQTSAPMQASPTMPQASPSNGRGMQAPSATRVVPLDAPTERPDEPVTTGIDVGAGAGSEVMYANPETLNSEDKKRLAQILPVLAQIAEMPTSSNAFRNYVSFIRGNL
jgi:hypothetical protein